MDVGFEKGYKRVRIYKADGAEKDEFVKKTQLREGTYFLIARLREGWHKNCKMKMVSCLDLAVNTQDLWQNDVKSMDPINLVLFRSCSLGRRLPI